MSRILCPRCQRPQKACICSFVTETNNTIPVVVLQHPNEVNHSKGTVALLAKSLLRCQVIVGENFTDNQELSKVFAQYNALLLYPSEKAEVLTFQVGNKTEEGNCVKEPCLVILDGTWKKAYRMLMLSKTYRYYLKSVCQIH